MKRKCVKGRRRGGGEAGEDEEEEEQGKQMGMDKNRRVGSNMET